MRNSYPNIEASSYGVMGSEYRRDEEAGSIEISQMSYIRSVVENLNVTRMRNIPASPSIELRPVGEEEDIKEVPFVRWSGF